MFRKNLFGDITSIYRGSTKVAEYKYDAWGNCTVIDPTTGLPTEAKGFIGNVNPFRYRGYYWDNDLQLYYLMSRYYDPQTGRFIQPANVSGLNPQAINGLNLYSYANNPIGVAYSSSSVGSLTEYRKIIITENPIIINNSYNNDLDLNFLGNLFAFNENIYSSIAGVLEGIRRKQGLAQYESLAKASKVLMHIGYWLNVGLSAYNYHDSSLTTQEKWVSFGVDTVYITGVTIGSYFLGMIPYVGPLLAIIVPIVAEYFWSGELSIFGFDIDVQPTKINGKTIEEWVKDWVNSWFE